MAKLKEMFNTYLLNDWKEYIICLSTNYNPYHKFKKIKMEYQKLQKSKKNKEDDCVTKKANSYNSNHAVWFLT